MLLIKYSIDCPVSLVLAAVLSVSVTLSFSLSPIFSHTEHLVTVHGALLGNSFLIFSVQIQLVVYLLPKKA